ncbi:MAG: hypothetical protein AAGJ35_05910 [Myxococcota bacterium]
MLIAQAKEDVWEYALPKLDNAVGTVAIGLDGAHILMRDDGWRESMVGNISLYDLEGERLHTLYIGEAPEHGKSTFLQRLEHEIHQIKQHYPNAEYIGIADGAKSNWSFLEQHTDKQLLDFFHVTESLSQVAYAAYPGKTDKPKREHWLKTRCHQLKHDQGAADTLIEEMDKLSAKTSLAKTIKEKLSATLTDFKNHRHRMDYPTHVEHNQPIGSGVTEAACKTLVKQRLQGCGGNRREQESSYPYVLWCNPRDAGNSFGRKLTNLVREFVLKERLSESAPCLPDGFDRLKAHNLLTYKSFHESLDAFALDELIGHLVNYQKRIEQRLDQEQVQLYAVTTRYPQKLFQQCVPMKTEQAGIYTLHWGQSAVCVVVLRQIAPQPHNAPWGFFSDQLEQIYQAAKDYTWKQPQAMIMQQLYRYYELEEFIQMSYTYEQFEKEFKQEFFLEHRKEFLQSYPIDELLQDLEAIDSLHLLRAEERLSVRISLIQDTLSSTILLEQLTADELLQGLTQDELRVVLEQLVSAGVLSQQVVAEVLVDW